jgi:hypothetical protein
VRERGRGFPYGEGGRDVFQERDRSCQREGVVLELNGVRLGFSVGRVCGGCAVGVGVDGTDQCFDGLAAVPDAVCVHAWGMRACDLGYAGPGQLHKLGCAALAIFAIVFVGRMVR